MKKLLELKCEEKARELKISLINSVCKKGRSVKNDRVMQLIKAASDKSFTGNYP
ncbi:hypothetical protein [Methanosarcina acetivorans]|uniref:hypothetical protein n=1 Tax=Methanosarcina acetivorans TaxID=2214 RepID=UPI000A845E54|nr:hypothetical protein [Methanosarcina acetivorans]